MIYNRFNPVRKHRELMRAAESEDLDMDGVRSILKELINATLPIDEHERKVVEEIEKLEKFMPLFKSEDH